MLFIRGALLSSGLTPSVDFGPRSVTWRRPRCSRGRDGQLDRPAWGLICPLTLSRWHLEEKKKKGGTKKKCQEGATWGTTPSIKEVLTKSRFCGSIYAQLDRQQTLSQFNAPCAPSAMCAATMWLVYTTPSVGKSACNVKKKKKKWKKRKEKWF